MKNVITTSLRRRAIRRAARRTAHELEQAGYTPHDLWKLYLLSLQLGIVPQGSHPPLADVLAAWPRARLEHVGDASHAGRHVLAAFRGE